MYYFFHRHVHHIYLGGLFVFFLIAEIIIFPTGNFPVNDDWWYFRLLTDQVFNLWPEHTFAGFWLAYKTWFIFFPDTIFSMRIFSIILGFLNIILLNRICARFLRLNSVINLFIGITLLFNPVYLHLCNSGMTEMIFIFYLLLGLFLYFEFLMYQRKIYLILSLILFILMTLTRQIGIALLFSLVLTDFLVNREYFKYSLVFFIVCVVSYVGLEYFLYYSDFNYDNFPMLFAKQTFGLKNNNQYLTTLFKRWLHYLTFASLLSSPITGLAFLYKYRTVLRSKSLLTISVVLMIPVILSLKNFPVGNYLNSGSLGPLNIPESYIFRAKALMYEKGVSYYIMLFLTTLFSFIFIILLCYQLTKIYQRFRRFLVSDILTNFQYFQILTLIFFLTYYALMTYFEGFFDRYILIPLIPFMLIFADLIKHHFSKSIISIVMIVLMMGYSVFSLHDYFSIRRISHEIFKEQLTRRIAVEGFIEDKGMAFLKDSLVGRLDPYHPNYHLPFIGTFLPENAKTLETREYFSLRKFKKEKIYLYQIPQNDENALRVQ
ncbi:MAG: hypothetical protein N3F09_04545 [Bacteroidia bacterium]|nr:hypothetical protein [Bacteroidia bacterium]